MLSRRTASLRLIRTAPSGLNTSDLHAGRLWLARVGEMAPKHPEWKQKEPFKSVLAGDRAAMGKFTEADWLQIVAATHTGMRNEAFAGLVQVWLAKAKAPRFDRPYTERTNPTCKFW
jgi:hypothetical protein